MSWLDSIEAVLLSRRRDATGTLPSRSGDTAYDYHQAYRQLLGAARIPCLLDDLDRLRWTIGWFSEQEGRWKPATIRHHEAVLIWAIETLAYAGLADAETVGDLLALLGNRPKPRDIGKNGRTSARKRMALGTDEHLRLVEHLRAGNKTKRLLGQLVAWGPYLALRPGEYRNAFLRGRTLVVFNGKTTNDRGLGDRRFLDLVGLDEMRLRALDGFLRAFNRAVAAAPSWNAFHERLAKTLTRACLKIGLAPISLYTLRHQGLANAKKMKMSRLHLAALAGHASLVTASRNYASKRGGWGFPLRCRPSALSVARVRQAPARYSMSMPKGP